MPSLHKNILQENSGYVKESHYNFYSTNILTKENQQQKQLFLTYKGMLKILFSSRTGNADKFVDWATETLFTVHLGTECDKNVREKLCFSYID